MSFTPMQPGEKGMLGRFTYYKGKAYWFQPVNISLDLKIILWLLICLKLKVVETNLESLENTEPFDIKSNAKKKYH